MFQFSTALSLFSRRAHLFFVACTCRAAMVCARRPAPHIALATLAYVGLIR